MPGEIRHGGAWSPITGLEVRAGGAWETVQAAWIRAGGAWEPFYVLWTPPPAPTDLTVTDTSYCDNSNPIITLRLDWTNSDPSKPTRIYESGTLYDDVAAGVDTYDSGQMAAGYFDFTVRHYDGGGESGDSNVADIALADPC